MPDQPTRWREIAYGVWVGIMVLGAILAVVMIAYLAFHPRLGATSMRGPDPVPAWPSR